MTAAMAQHAREMKVRRTPKFQIRYEHAFWVIFLITTGLFIADRFWTNYWPRQSFGLDRGGGTDKVPLKDGPWTVQAYDIVARTSGRFSMAAMNGMFFTMMHTTFNRLSEVEGSVIDFDGWQEANMRIHRVLGWTLGLLMVPHVWSPFFVVWSHGWEVESVWTDDPRSELDFPVSELKLNCSTVDTEKERICMNSDDYGRLIGISIMFCVLFPLSRSGWFLEANWSMCKWVHVVLAALYAFDLIRRRSHPHSWVLNGPVCVLYIADVVVGWYFYRCRDCKVVGRLRLDADYSVVYWQTGDYHPPLVGDVHYLRAPIGTGGTSRFERAHPFTCIGNRLSEPVPAQITTATYWKGHAFVEEASVGDGVSEADGTAAAEDAAQWDVAAIVKHHAGGKRACCGCVTQTPLILDDAVDELEVAGPYRSAYAALSSLASLPEHTTLISSGSGGSFIVDFADAVTRWEQDALTTEPIAADPESQEPEKKKTVVVVYTTRSVPLLQFVTDRLQASTLIDLDVTHVALTADGSEFHESPARGESSPLNEPVGNGSEAPSSPQSEQQIYAMQDALQRDTGMANPALDAALMNQAMKMQDKASGRPTQRDLTDLTEPLPRRGSIMSLGTNRRNSACSSLQTQRLSIPEILEEHTPAGGHVYFCGSAGLYQVVKRSCAKARLCLHDTHEFDG